MSLHLKISSRTENLHQARDFVSEQARAVGFDEEVVGMIALAVDEACTNIIKHAYQYAPDKNIEINIEKTNGTFIISIIDQGKSFNPSEIHSPDMKEYLSNFRRGGLGLHLMRSLMDQVDYNSNGNTNVVRMVKSLPSKKSA